MGSLTNPDDPQAAQARDEAEQLNMLLAFWLGGLAYGTLFLPLLRLRELDIAILDRSLRHSVPEIREAGFKDTSATWLILCKGILSSDVFHACHYDSLHGFAPSVMMAVQVWLGDALIYRCLIIWQYNWWVVCLPILLLAHSIVNNSILMASLMHPKALTFTQVRPVIDMVYPINITQSCLTTALITLKLWRQYRLSRSAGLTAHGSGVGLLTVMRIIVESTMIFTVQQVIMCALYYLDKPAQYVFHGTLVPSIGTFSSDFQYPLPRTLIFVRRASDRHYIRPSFDQGERSARNYETGHPNSSDVEWLSDIPSDSIQQRKRRHSVRPQSNETQSSTNHERKLRTYLAERVAGWPGFLSYGL
ncbi:hypothetical protein NMY22_g5908 [Coprinellus aureogranulatus]|nr:hypothetical protein NMY22_g5908 [Coprinellus aureogranulatus]